MTVLNLEDGTGAGRGQLPPFVKTDGIIRYWVPERTGLPDLDYAAGRKHFRQAVRYATQAATPLFLARVLLGMVGDLQEVERGFLDALLSAAKVGVVPAKVTDDEMIAMGLPVSAWDQARTLEARVVAALSLRAWFMPDQLLLFIYGMLSGVDGEHVGAAITMIARTAINGTRN